MEKAPKALRLHIAVFGRTNVGKSSFLNMVAGQDVAITSSVPGTTTDVVEKTMELLPLGPVVFLDTAGMDDSSVLGEKRLEKTCKVFARADVVCLIAEAGIWGDFEEKILKECRERDLSVIGIINKIDAKPPEEDFVSLVKNRTSACLEVSSVNIRERDRYVTSLKEILITLMPGDFLRPPPLIGDLVRPGGMAVLVVPIDLEAPKGRIILPQVQTIRDALDNDAMTLVVKEREYSHVFSLLKGLPDIAVCDSQVVMKFVADTPREVKCTTFSILFSRYKGDLMESVRGALAIDRLNKGDKVLIAESCSHHAVEDDIGRVKIPRWLRQYLGHDIQIDVRAGKDYPDNLAEYGIVIHCGGCMINRREMLSRINLARAQGVPVTNYGVCISYVQGVLKRVLSPFPEALAIYEAAAQLK